MTPEQDQARETLNLAIRELISAKAVLLAARTRLEIAEAGYQRALNHAKDLGVAL